MKKIIKELLVPLLASKPVSYVAEKYVRPGVPVFMFHRFNSDKNSVKGHKPEYVRQCLQYLKNNNYNFVSIEEVINSIRDKQELPRRSIAFTIDDGFLDHATVAAPIFIEYKCPVTIFLISGMLDGELWPWDDKIAYLINNTQLRRVTFELKEKSLQFSLDDSKQKKDAIGGLQNIIKTLDASFIDEYLKIISNGCELELPAKAPVNYQSMTWDMARELEKKGVCFAPHTHTHTILSQLNEDQSHYEVVNSWKRINEELASPAPVFCYPTGRKTDYTDREIEIIKSAGLIGAVSTEPTSVDPLNDDSNYLYRLPRFGFPQSFSDFVQYSSWIERAKS